MDLQTFICEQDSRKALKRIVATVDPQLEVAALCRREFATGSRGRILLFERVLGSDLPIVANLFGSAERAARMLRCRSFDEFSTHLSGVLQRTSGTVRDRLLSPPNWLPQLIANPRCQQVVAATDVTKLPAICSWPAEQKPYLTLALLVTRHPQTLEMNLGLYRAQLLDSRRIAINFSAESDAAKHLAVATQMRQPLPVSLVLGGDPAWIWAAAAPLPHGCNEFSFCQELFQVRYPFADCLSQPLTVPAEAEIVIEGEIHPGETCLEGPFGNHSGGYVSRADCPVMQDTAMSHREQAVLPVTVVGPPPSENVYLGKANEALLRIMLRIDYPQIRDLQMPPETIFHGVSLISVAPQSQIEIKALIDQLWTESPLRRAKLLVLLDEDISLSSLSQSWWRTINQLSGHKIYQNSGRIALDATGVDPAALVMENQQTIELLKRRSREYTL